MTCPAAEMVDGSKVLYFEQVSERLINISSSYSISLSLPPYLLSFTLLLLLLAITCFSATNTNISVFTNFISVANARHSGGPLRSPFARYIVFLVELYCSFISLNHDT